jgi:hypothetical protein
MMIRLAALLLIVASSIRAGEEKADVIVYGATPGGFCAAIAAAREGAAVILLEPTDHVGGVNTGGLSFSDSNQTVRSTVMGLFEEWHSRIEQDYRDRGVNLGYFVAEKDHKPWTYEPHVAARVTKAMLDEARVKVLTKRALKKVTKEDARITKIETTDGGFSARMFVDATYEGDLMAAAGVSWTIGREGRKEFGESYAGKQYPKAKMPIGGLDESGKQLPLTTTTDAGADEDGDKNVMVYSFRLCVTSDPNIRVPFPMPDKYDPARFEVVRRYFAQEKKPVLPWDFYPLPGEKKFDANNGIGKQFSMGLVGACNGWSEADEAGRKKIWEAHKQYTLEFYRFLISDPSVPHAIRDHFLDLGLCKDEFADYGHWSPQLYVREGRRMKGMYVLSQKDIIDDPKKGDPIAVSSFPIDSHDCQRVASKDSVVNEGTIFPVRIPGRRHGYPYHVPYRAILPVEKECENLLVPVALSCTHVAISSIRVEPTWMIIGQGAGVAAAMCAKRDVTVQELPYGDLREKLLEQKQVLDLPLLPELPGEPAGVMSIDPKKLPGIVLDDTQAQLEGTWVRSSNFKPHVGTGYLHDDHRADGKSVATFRFKAPKQGRYDLRMAYSAHETRAKKMRLLVVSGEKKTYLLVDQTKLLPAGEAFRSLGTVDLVSDVETTITLNNSGTDGFVILDALQLIEKAD